ncbi:hypothetical protein Tco_1129150, partial [Tanacetum coccineum]
QAHLVDTDTESDPKESQPLGSGVPLMSEEFEAFGPSGTSTVSSHSPVSSDSTAPLHPIIHLLMFHLPLHPLEFHFTVGHHTPSSSSSPTLPVWKRYRGTSELILDTDSEGDELGDEDTEEDVEDESQGLDDESQGLDDEGQGLDDEGQGLEDEGPGMEEEDAAPEGQQQAVLVVDTAMSKPLGLGYRAARRRALYSTKEIAPNPEDGRVYTDILTYVPLVAPVQTPPSPEWSLGSLPVSPSSLVVPSPIASLVATLAATISVDEDHFIKLGA